MKEITNEIIDQMNEIRTGIIQELEVRVGKVEEEAEFRMEDRLG